MISDGLVAYVESKYVLERLLVIGDGDDEGKDERRSTESNLDIGVSRGSWLSLEGLVESTLPLIDGESAIKTPSTRCGFGVGVVENVL